MFPLFETNNNKSETNIPLKMILKYLFCLIAKNMLPFENLKAMQLENYSYGKLSDKELVNLARADDRKAFSEIYNRYRRMLISSALQKIRCHQKAEDIVQDIFMSFYHRRNSIEISVSLDAYFRQSLRYKVMNEFRAEKVRSTYQNFFYHTHAYRSNSSFNYSYEAKEFINEMNETIMQLPNKCRKAFLLSREDDLSYKDISKHLNISVSTVEKHICKALKLLKYNLS